MSHSACALAHLGLQRPDSVLRLQGSELVFSKRKLRQAEIIQLVREKRERETQTLGVFIAPVCPLWAAGQAAESRLSAPRTPQWAVSAASHWASDVWSTVGQDRLVPLSLATLDAQQQRQAITFRSAEMLDTFGLPQGGSQYRRLIASFQRVFGATIFFGTDTRHEKAPVLDQVRFHFLSEARLWYTPESDGPSLPGADPNRIVLSNEFYREVLSHPIPTDLEAAKALSSSPAALDLFLWLSYRCFYAKGLERIPLFGELDLMAQLGSAEYARPRKFRERLQRWLEVVVRLMAGLSLPDQF